MATNRYENIKHDSWFFLIAKERGEHDMNFMNEEYRENEMEQNNDKKGGKGLIVGGSILAAALLIGGISLIGSCSGKNSERMENADSVSGNGTGISTSDSVVSREMLKEELKAISEQLTKLDKEVINNQTTLQQVLSSGEEGDVDGMNGIIIGGSDGVNDEYMTLVTKELSSIKNVYDQLLAKVTNHENLFNTYLENYVAVTGGNQNAIVDLQACLTETREMISVTNQSINETLEMLTNKQEVNQNKLLEQFSNVKNDILKTENMILEAQKDLTDTLDDMDESLKENHSELIGSMNAMQESFEKAQAEELEIVQENFAQLNTYLETAFSAQTENFTMQLETVYGQLQEQIGGVDELLGKAEDTLNSFYEEYQADTKEQTEALRALDTSVADAKQQMADVKEELSDTLAQMEFGNAERQEALDQKLDTVKTAVDEVKEQLVGVSENIIGLLDNMSEQQKAEHEAVINTLNEVQTGLQDTLDNGFSEVSQTLDGIKSKLDENRELMESRFADLDESMKAAATEKTAELKAEMKDMLTVIQEDFDHVDEQLSDAKVMFDTFKTEYREDIEASGMKLDQIESAITAAFGQMAESEKNITDALSRMEGNAEVHHEELTASLDQIRESIVTSQNQIIEVSGAINETLERMSKQQKADHEELAAALADMEVSIMDGMEYHFTVMGQDLAAMQEKMESEFVIMQETFGEGVNVLQGQMTDIHSQIAATQDEIKELMISIDEKRDLQYEDVMEAIENAVDDINSEMNSAHNNLQGLIRVLTADVAMNHRDTLDTLEEMEGSMSDTLADNMEQINDSFSGLTSTLEEQFKQVQENQNAAQDALDTVVEELGTDLTENQQVILEKLKAHDAANTAGQEYIKQTIENHNNDMHLESAEIKGDIEEHNTGILSALEGFVNTIEQKLDSVFTFVSNGKKKLASALLTKNVTVNEDATFQEFADAILNIPQEIVIGVQQLPGEIEYEYHYHTDGSGNTLHKESNSASGGCYTVPTYHQHTSACNSSTKCGGSVSYKTSSTHWKCSSTLDCAEHGCWWEDPNAMYPSGCWHCYCPEETYTECNSCGATNSGSPCGRTVTKQTCGKSTSTVEGYKAGCGLTDGQIIGAHIVYSGAAASSMAISTMSLEMPEEEVMEEPVMEEWETYPQIELPEGAAIDRGESETVTEEQENAETVPEETENVEMDQEEAKEVEMIPEEVEDSSETDAADPVETETDAEYVFSETEEEFESVTETVETENSEEVSVSETEMETENISEEADSDI